MKPISQDDLETMVVCTVRYSLGRRSYIIGDAASIVRYCWADLRPSMQAVIFRDVSEAIERAESGGTTVGMQMDHDVWVLLRSWMRENLRQEDEA